MSESSIGRVSYSPAGATPPAAADTKLNKAARDFESMLLANWLEKMQGGSGTLGGEETDAAHDNLRSMAVQMAATGIASAGGIGIARMLLKQIHGAGITNVTAGNVKATLPGADARVGEENSRLTIKDF